MTTLRIELADGNASYQPYNVDDFLKEEVDKLTRQIADIDITYGTKIRCYGTKVPGLYVGPPMPTILVDPTRGHDSETQLVLTIATAAHERGHAAYTPSSQEEKEVRWQKPLPPWKHDLFRFVIHQLEDERIERIILNSFSNLEPYFHKSWQYVIDSQILKVREKKVFSEYGMTSLYAAIKADYYNRMLNCPNWFKSPVWQPVSSRVLDVIKQTRHLIKEELRPDRPDSVPFLAYRLLKSLEVRFRGQA